MKLRQMDQIRSVVEPPHLAHSLVSIVNVWTSSLVWNSWTGPTAALGCASSGGFGLSIVWPCCVPRSSSALCIAHFLIFDHNGFSGWSLECIWNFEKRRIVLWQQSMTLFLFHLLNTWACCVRRLRANRNKKHKQLHLSHSQAASSLLIHPYPQCIRSA